MVSRNNNSIPYVAPTDEAPPIVVLKFGSSVLNREDGLASARGVENRVVIHPRGKTPIVLSGKGAGRWPTTAAVLADLLDLYRAEARCRDHEEVCS